MIVTNSHYFSGNTIHILEGYGEENDYSTMYAEIMATVRKITDKPDVQLLSIVKTIESNETKINTAKYYFTCSFKEKNK